ncbi:MAG: UDP-2,3-diacylglucosamine diphosphatase LpxI [Desulfobacterales bacterium]|nr:UDP-2,3-diacylglucosamine diphosphatase LpxI [Desulfobacterales bacterium]MBF0396689.1 UDP-2,3-diacylglucosamine diphosphatase LpxI [Desulfobacterales bacterium]
MNKIGLIAGNGQFPIMFAKKAKEKGISVYAVAHINETEESLKDFVFKIEWIHVGQLKKLIDMFKSNGVTDAVMVGGIKKTRMFYDVKPDIKAIKLISNIKTTHDDGLLRAVADTIEQEGITIKASTFLMPELIADKGCWTKRKPSRTERADIDIGWKIAKELGKLDVGQSVVVSKRSVLALEAIDGTDATISRAGNLAKAEEIVVVKVCKPNQDMRFDVPAIGSKTIQTMYEAKATALAIEAGKALVFDKEEMVSLANKFNISIIAL